MSTIDLKLIPSSPGVYIYRNQAQEIIYVGKAINLKKRVSQYFQRDDALGVKTKSLVSQIDSIETHVVGSEIEALILEASYIKKFRPKFNSLMKDDRSYQYICITKEKFPRLFSVFESTKIDHADYFGPFPGGTYVKQLLKTLRRLYPYYGQKNHPKGECLYCHLHLCPGPNPEPKLYRQNISKIKKILTGKFKLIQRQLTKEIKYFSSTEQYEFAQKAKKELDALNYIVTGWHDLKNLFSHINLPNDDQQIAISELISTLSPYLQIKKINRIECFDISQMVNKYFVGSMTVWQNGSLDHTQYRQFKISGNPDTPNDQFMIREVVTRRLTHPEWSYPDLIIVDGGKPQVGAALAALSQSEQSETKSIALVGLAKKFETIVLQHQQQWVEINLPKNSKALLLLTSLRDEAHRFANRYRKKLMQKSLHES